MVSLEKDWSIRLGGTKPARAAGGEVVSLRRVGTPLPAFPSEEQVLFANGDRLPGRVLGWTGERLHFQAVLGNGQELDLPLMALSVVWFVPPDDVDDPEWLIRKMATEKRRRDQVWLRNGDLVEGIVTGMDRQVLRLEVARKPVEAALNKVAAVALSSALARLPQSAQPFGRVVVTRGGRLSLAEAHADGSVLTGRTFFGAEVRLSWNEVVALDLRQGRAVYLSDLKPRAYQFTSYLGEGQWPYVPDGSVDGHDLILGGSTFDKGLGMHSASRLSYDLEGRYQRFEARVGLDDRAGRDGRARIGVLVDGKPQDLGGDPELTRTDGPRLIQVNLAGARELTLVVEFGRRGDVQGRVDWADARLIKD
ncbi:MAG: NPCBM/NEW2 domain-containing protein [Planctomycetes bacterium]|nr:NPCBM/NEW2 domain-containing protein [Planctomycetota bacterium]